MAAYGLQFLFFVSFVVISVHGDSPLKDLGSTADCESQCHKEFTSADDGNKSCARGCRFFNIANFLKGDKEPLVLCHESCGEAYSSKQPTQLKACNEGCSKQAWAQVPTPAPLSPLMNLPPFFGGGGLGGFRIGFRLMDDKPAAADSSSSQQDADIQAINITVGEGSKDREAGAAADDDGEGIDGAFSLGKPVMQVRKVMAQVLGSLHIIKTSVMTYFLQDDNTLLAVQSEPVTILEMAPQSGFESPEDSLQSAHEDDLLEPQSREENTFTLNELSSSPSDSVSRVSLSSSRRYAYLLHLLLLLAAVSLSLLGLSYCLALARHQQKKTLKATNLHVALQAEPLKLVRPEDLTKLSLMEEEDNDKQAPPLPKKQDLALTHQYV